MSAGWLRKRCQSRTSFERMLNFRYLLRYSVRRIEVSVLCFDRIQKNYMVLESNECISNSSLCGKQQT